MPYTVTMPKLSPTMEEGVVAKWLKKEGEFIESGETLLEITTDKATVEHAALDEGWLRQVLVSEGTAVRVNEPIAIFTEEKEESIEGYLPKNVEAPEKKTEEKEEKGVEMKEESVQTSGAAIATPSHIPEPPLKSYDHPAPQEAPGERILASPLAKQLAKKMGLDLKTVKGTGPGGRITSRDLEKAQPEGMVTFGRNEHPQIAPGTYREIPLTPMRKVIAKRLQESKSFIPHFYLKQVVNAEPMIHVREQLKNLGLKVSFNDMIVRASALALKSHPSINRGFNSLNQTIIQYETVDISIAVSIEEGLITPIVRHADFKNLGQISSEVKSLAKRAQTGKLKESEYKGGSFCISNLGMYGITEFTAVINPPQAAILAVGSIDQRPVLKEGKVVPGHTLTLTLSSDHRVIDGGVAAKFLRSLQNLLENPVGLTL
ncbi:MAG: Dihydrolipoyllysine-residue acetyltransferase component of pyruvate dehydrogenase complex [Chlamydiales bacterium]|nr:Dihydrolipoyllysine-residue acetyltransferase component of pyruvate dehydrogenase complex [Chlamydiales bacterium]MCH9620138.1 Dihydrolipoyllysine-residue acetyltransferase component of pyruvate dehydrogenase complex [Chlamydiales bacterium]MCH9623608.1 Dihydrolipoyllysine-residue acetyltransferase component of pyruvate dehydrogenase complex [Chlamydiales bacterium]